MQERRHDAHRDRDGYPHEVRVGTRQPGGRADRQRPGTEHHARPRPGWGRRSAGPSPRRAPRMRSPPPGPSSPVRPARRRPISTARATAVTTASTRTARGTAASSASDARRRSSAASAQPLGLARRGSRPWSAAGSPAPGGSGRRRGPAVGPSGPTRWGSEPRLPPSREASCHSSLRPPFGWFVVDGAGIPCAPEHERGSAARERWQHLDGRTGRDRAGPAAPPTRRRGRSPTAATGRSAGCSATAADTTSSTVGAADHVGGHSRGSARAGPVADGHPVVAANGRGHAAIILGGWSTSCC